MSRQRSSGIDGEHPAWIVLLGRYLAIYLFCSLVAAAYAQQLYIELPLHFGTIIPFLGVVLLLILRPWLAPGRRSWRAEVAVIAAITASALLSLMRFAEIVASC
ncbi:MAG: hypothetical protein H6807_12685 [Planctomycetes bacterium]|nr:hypothetical protein [Planctomycetota bacterium]